MISNHEVRKFSLSTQGLYHRCNNLRALRDGISQQQEFLAALEGIGPSEHLLRLSGVVPGLEDILKEFPKGAISQEALRSTVVDKSMTSVSVKTAAVQDWLTDTADALRGFIPTADYHLAGLMKILEEASPVVYAKEHDPEFWNIKVAAKPYDTRIVEIDNLSKVYDLLSPIEGTPNPKEADLNKFGSTLVYILNLTSDICGISINKSDFNDISDKGLFCQETVTITSLRQLGYNKDTLAEVVYHLHNLLGLARELVKNHGAYIAGVLSAKKTFSSNESDALNVTANPDDFSDPKTDALGADSLTNPRSDAIGEESFKIATTALANYVTLLTVVLDCTVHIGLEVVNICEVVIK